MTLRDEVCDWKIDGGQSFSITYGEGKGVFLLVGWT